MAKYTFSVFTPTYNRAHLLPRVYECLKEQTFQDFEWIIVDDGSTDGTDKLVQDWLKENRLTIRYHYKQNGGKLRAFKDAIALAEGELFVTIDSDDYCVPNALERLLYHWNAIPESERSRFASVSALCKDEKGEIIGTRFPGDVFDSDVIAVHAKYKVKGDKWAFYRTDVLREISVPEVPGERRIASSWVWYKVAQKYKTRFVNEALLIKEYQADGLTRNLVKVRVQNPIGTRMYYLECLSIPANLRFKLRNAINYIRFALHGSMKYFQVVKESRRPVLVTLLFLPGYCLYLKDRNLLQR